MWPYFGPKNYEMRALTMILKFWKSKFLVQKNEFFGIHFPSIIHYENVSMKQNGTKSP